MSLEPVASGGVVQAWVELRAEDPEAVSARFVARARLEAGRALAGLRRLRLIELRGRLPERAAVEELLHRSTRFYNPHKERCTVRAGHGEAAPVEPGDQVVLIVGRGVERRRAAERWWQHETGERIEVREGVAWVLTFEPGEPGRERAEELATLRDVGHGLLCNPNSQDVLFSGSGVPLPWMSGIPMADSGGGAS